MENVILYVKNLVVMVIIISALLNVTIGEKYGKYLRFIVGLLLVSFAMTSIKELISDFDEIEATEDVWVEGGGNPEETETMRNSMIDEAVLDSYASGILYSLQTSGYDATCVECFYEEGVLAVNFYTENTNNHAGIKKYINDFYHIDSPHIYGYTEAEDE